MLYVCLAVAYLLSGIACATVTRIICGEPEKHLKGSAWFFIAFNPLLWIVMAAGYSYRWWRWVNE